MRESLKYIHTIHIEPNNGIIFNVVKINKILKIFSFKNVIFGYWFNQNIDNLFNEIHNNIENIKFINFNQPLNNTLSGLTNLKTLHLGGKFNQPLGESLYHLVNLEELNFGVIEDQTYNEGMKTYLSPEYKICEDFIVDKEDKDLFNNLNLLYMSSDYDQPIGDSLKNNNKLKKLYLNNGDINRETVSIFLCIMWT